MKHGRRILVGAALLAALSASPVMAQPAGIAEGIAAWQAGDYERAVATWRPLADAGNADAQFNLGQAYRLGRGVAQNMTLAEQWFERAARQRHEQAGANLGLLLFQNGRAREAMPWIQAAALRGDPRAQYVFGTALFNGDILRRDMPRAYAMMTLAARQNFPQAQEQLRQMDGLIAPEDRARGIAMADETGGAAPAPRETYAEREPEPSQTYAGREPEPSQTYAEREPEPSPTYAEREPEAGVTWQPQPRSRVAEPEPVRPQAAERPRRPDRQVERPAPRPREVRTAATGTWRVQLGAFSNSANARRAWASLSRRVSALGTLQPAYTSAGPVTRLRTGPVGGRADAVRVCAAVRAAGGDCIPVAP
jgi:uncharacterized protein